MPLELDPRSCQPGFGPHIPACFTSLEEAQNSLYYQQNRCLKVACDFYNTASHADRIGPLIECACLDSYCQNRTAFRSILQKWNAAFEAFLVTTGATMDSKALQGAAVLKVNHRITALHIEDHGQDAFHSSLSWDLRLRECEEIVDLASSIVQARSHKSNNGSEKPIFSMDQNIVTPLFSIAHRCRDPIIRRRAIALLYSAPRQEGLWHSIITARVAEKIMMIEEAGLGEVESSADVPDENRISEIDVQFDLQGRKGYLKGSRRQLTSKHIYVAEPVVNVFEEIIEW